MNIVKENNQYYGAFIESRIVAYINNEEYVRPDIIKDFVFTDEELAELEADALSIAKYIGGSRAVWVGRNTSNEDCDLIVDGRKIEIKYVSVGTGTYLNSSLSYFSEVLGFTPFVEYTHKAICPFLEKYFGASVYENLSPVSKKEADAFRKGNKDGYAELTKIDKAMRKEYVSDLYNFLIDNPNKLNLFISDALSKKASSKEAPGELIVFNHKEKTFMTFTKEDINSKTNSKAFKKSDLGFVFDCFRVQIGWQNGTGLNNPTFRVFLD